MRVVVSVVCVVLLLLVSTACARVKLRKAAGATGVPPRPGPSSAASLPPTGQSLGGSPASSAQSDEPVIEISDSDVMTIEVLPPPSTWKTPVFPDSPVQKTVAEASRTSDPRRIDFLLDLYQRIIKDLSFTTPTEVRNCDLEFLESVTRLRSATTNNLENWERVFADMELQRINSYKLWKLGALLKGIERRIALIKQYDGSDSTGSVGGSTSQRADATRLDSAYRTLRSEVEALNIPPKDELKPKDGSFPAYRTIVAIIEKVRQSGLSNRVEALSSDVTNSMKKWNVQRKIDEAAKQAKQAKADQAAKEAMALAAAKAQKDAEALRAAQAELARARQAQADAEQRARQAEADREAARKAMEDMQAKQKKDEEERARAAKAAELAAKLPAPATPLPVAPPGVVPPKPAQLSPPKPPQSPKSDTAVVGFKNGDDVVDSAARLARISGSSTVSSTLGPARDLSTAPLGTIGFPTSAYATENAKKAYESGSLSPEDKAKYEIINYPSWSPRDPPQYIRVGGARPIGF